MVQWGFMSRLLDNAHTNFIRTIGWTVLFLLRIMVLCFLADDVFDDGEQFHCKAHTAQCRDQCYGEAFPINPVRIWTMQLIFVAFPTLIYLGLVAHVTRSEKLREKLASPQNGGVKIKGKLLFTYVITLLLKILIEAASIYGQYRLYRSVPVPGQCESYLDLFKVDFIYKCNAENDPAHWCGKVSVPCFMPNNTEKTLTIRYMVGVACFSVFLNVIEMLYLIGKMKCCFRSCRRRNDPREEEEEEGWA